MALLGLLIKVKYKSKEFYPHSYQVHHVLAKNLIERGVEELQRENAGCAVYYFGKGRSKMEKIIEDKLYDRVYSILSLRI